MLTTSTTYTSYTFADLTSTTSAQTIKIQAVAEDGTVSTFSNSVTYYYEEAPSTTITAPSSLKINNTSASSFSNPFQSSRERANVSAFPKKSPAPSYSQPKSSVTPAAPTSGLNRLRTPESKIQEKDIQIPDFLRKR